MLHWGSDSWASTRWGCAMSRFFALIVWREMGGRIHWFIRETLISWCRWTSHELWCMIHGHFQVVRPFANLECDWFQRALRTLHENGNQHLVDEPKLLVTVCGIGNHTLSVGFRSFRFGGMNPRSWRDAPKWWRFFLVGILVMPSQVLWVRVWREFVWGEDCMLLQICNKILSSSPLIYTLEFYPGGVRDNLTHCVHLKREVEHFSCCRGVLYMCVFFFMF